MTEYFAWQKKQWTDFLSSFHSDRLAHAYFLSGAEGLGQIEFAKRMLSCLLCDLPNEQGDACGVCQSCLLLETSIHPDYCFLAPEEEGKTIKVDQVRALSQFVHQTAQISKRKFVLLAPADAMNVSASNALLKTLEEPAKNTVLVLVSSHLSRLPATVRSRCQLIPFYAPPFELAKTWLEKNHEKLNTDYSVLLKLSNGAPLRAKAMLESGELELRQALFSEWVDWQRGRFSLMDLSARWAKLSSKTILFHLTTWVADILNLLLINESSNLMNEDFSSELLEITQGLIPSQVSNYFSYLQQQQGMVSSKVSLNEQLFMEDILVNWLKTKKNREISYAR